MTHPLDTTPKTSASHNIKALAAKLLRHGYSPHPIQPGTKRPSVNGWEKPTTKEDIDGWISNGRADHPVGINTDNTPGVDLDIRYSEMQIYMRRFVEKHVGPAPMRVGAMPKSLMLFRTDKPFSKITSKVYRDPWGEKAQVEILGKGQQCVIYGKHPDTGQLYHWHDTIDHDFDHESGGQSRIDTDGVVRTGGFTPVAPRQLDPLHCPARHLPKITESQGREIVDEFQRRAEELGWPLWVDEKAAAQPAQASGKPASTPKAKSGTVLANGHDTGAGDDDNALADAAATARLDLTEEQIRRYIDRLLPNNYNRDVWLRIGFAIHHETDGSEFGFETFDKFSEQYDGSAGKNGYSEADTEKAWKSFKTRDDLWNITFRYVLDLTKGREALRHAYNPAQWAQRDVPKLDFLLGELLHTTSRMMIAGPTGIGKTLITLDMAFAIAGGIGFLDWRGSGTPRRVLYIDGEMGIRLVKLRVAEAGKRTGISPEGLVIICTEDFPDMQPLTTKAGQKWVDGLIAAHGGFDLIISDNLQALTTGNLRETDVWEAVKPWSQSLSRRSIGQIWIDHTGLDETHAYGDSTKQWGLETSILLGKLDKLPPGVDVGFKLTFPKARNRAPWNRNDFRPIDILLVGDNWESTGAAPPVKLSPQQQEAFDLIPDNRNFATWLKLCAASTGVTIAGDVSARTNSARNIIRKLIDKRLVAINGDTIVLPKDEVDQPFDE